MKRSFLVPAVLALSLWSTACGPLENVTHAAKSAEQVAAEDRQVLDKVADKLEASIAFLAAQYAPGEVVRLCHSIPDSTHCKAADVAAQKLEAAIDLAQQSVSIYRATATGFDKALSDIAEIAERLNELNDLLDRAAMQVL